MGIRKYFRDNKFRKNLPFILYILRFKFYEFVQNGLKTDRTITEEKFKSVFERNLDLNNPKTLNEKIQWLKLYDRKPFHTVCADKYEVRNYLSTLFGTEYLIPLYLCTSKYKEVTKDNICKYPCIIKANHTSGDYIIVRDPEKVDWVDIQYSCRFWLHKSFYRISQEWQYKNIKRKIVVEKLLQTKEGKIPNDYKLHYINGELVFVYVSVDREGANKRNIYDKDWNPLPFSWVARVNSENVRGLEIPPPPTFEKMKEMASIIAKDFKYVRVDFYDVDGKLYFGEITLHHGGGFDVFTPEEYDYKFGELLEL